MWPVVARRFFYPLHERLLRRPTMRFTHRLEDSQWESPDALRALQESKLRTLLRHAQTHTRFYRRRIRLCGIDLHAERLGEQLGKLPLLDKEDVRTAAEEMVWRDAPGGLFRSHTGGSSGEPLKFYLDRRRQAYDQAARIRTHRWFGVKLGEREVYLWGSPIELGRTDDIRHVRDALQNHLLLSAFDMSPQRMDDYLDTLERYQPVCMFGYPSSLALLAQHGCNRGRRIRLRRLRAVFVTGEVCYPYHRDTIQSYFGAAVADGYGSREGGFIAHACPEGNLHLTAENVFVEIVREGRCLPVGETGEIVVTHLDALAMPFIRYRTGDIGRLKAGRCVCGRGLPMMEVVEGRTTDFLYLPDGRIKHALSIIYPLRTLSGLRQFRVIQHADYRVQVEVVRERGADRITCETVTRRVRPVLGEGVEIEVSLVDRIAATKSGKHHHVVSHVVPKAREPSREGYHACPAR